MNICVTKENVSRETLKNKKNKKNEKHKDNENNKQNRFIFMKNGKTMFHVKHFMDKYLEK